MADPVRARDCQIGTYRRAECTRPECGYWQGPLREEASGQPSAFQRASSDRSRHLAAHADGDVTTDLPPGAGASHG